MIKSHNKRKILPKRIDPMINFLWLVVLKINLTRLGTANPTKEIGPQNAVTNPVNIDVIIINNQRIFLVFSPKNCALFSPMTNKFNGFTKNRTLISAIKKNKLIIGICERLTCCTDPKFQTVKERNASKEDSAWIIWTIEEVKADNITPTISKEVVDFTFKLNPKIIKENTIAPIIADEMTDILDEKTPEDIKAIATNKLDPDEIPNIDGPAKGLLK